MKAKRVRSDQRNQHERFVRDAIGRSLLTLPFANLDAGPTGEVYSYYKKLSEFGAPDRHPPGDLLRSIVALVTEDAAINEACGNFLKADVERRWCEGLLLHFSYGQDLVAP